MQCEMITGGGTEDDPTPDKECGNEATHWHERDVPVCSSCAQALIDEGFTVVPMGENDRGV